MILSTNSLTSKTCAVLGKIIAADHTFAEYKFAHCMLSEDAVKGLTHGFSRNTYVRKLDSKGNNIRGPAAESVGKMLRHNKSIVSLCLEWNALGMLDNAFTIFCEGVSTNNTLQALDLRNNQVSHDSAAELCRSLKQNSSIKSLDCVVQRQSILQHFQSFDLQLHSMAVHAPQFQFNTFCVGKGR